MPSEAPAAISSTPPRQPKLVLKIAPDLDESELSAIAAVVRSSGVDGVIVSNTTLRRPQDLSDRTCFYFALHVVDAHYSHPDIRDLLAAMART